MRIDTTLGPRRRLSMMPLVDIIFLLLMFFLLSSTFSKFSTLEMERLEASSKFTGETWPALHKAKAILVTIDGAGKISVGGKKTRLRQLMQSINKLYDSGARSVVIVPRKGSSVQHLVSVVERIRISKVKIVTMAN